MTGPDRNQDKLLLWQNYSEKPACMGLHSDNVKFLTLNSTCYRAAGPQISRKPALPSPSVQREMPVLKDLTTKGTQSTLWLPIMAHLALLSLFSLFLIYLKPYERRGHVKCLLGYSWPSNSA